MCILLIFFFMFLINYLYKVFKKIKNKLRVIFIKLICRWLLVENSVKKIICNKVRN